MVRQAFRERLEHLEIRAHSEIPELKELPESKVSRVRLGSRVSRVRLGFRGKLGLLVTPEP